jgi:thiol-disulfide isomerase/thioredoxin
MQAGTPVQVNQGFGSVLDDFTLRSITGAEESLSGYLRGKKGAIVIFWSGLCSHCVRYDQYLNCFGERHPELGLIAIASRQGETPEQMLKTVADRGLTFPILHDPGSKIAVRWFTQQTPRVFLIDANRVLLYRGAIDNYKYPNDPEHIAYLEPAITEFLDGRPVSRTETASFGCAIQSVYYILPKSL